MADQRKGGIAYCDETWSPAIGCSPVSAGCKNCWAKRQAARMCGPGKPYEGLVRDGEWTGKTRMVEHVLDALVARLRAHVRVLARAPSVPGVNVYRLREDCAAAADYEAAVAVAEAAYESAREAAHDEASEGAQHG